MTATQSIDGIIFDAVSTASERKNLEAWESDMYNRVRSDFFEHGGYEAANNKPSLTVIRLEASKVADLVNTIWPKDQTGEDLPDCDVNRIDLMRKFRERMEEISGSYIPQSLAMRVWANCMRTRRAYNSLFNPIDLQERTRFITEDVAKKGDYQFCHQVLQIKI